MKLLLLLLFTNSSMLLVAQSDIATPDVDTFFVLKKDTINLVDSLGKRQGKWILLGADLPESGVISDGKAEEGFYFNNQKVGAWKRYDKDGFTVNALLYFKFNPNGTNAIREAIFINKYHSNGSPSFIHYTGLCPNKANLVRYDENGTVLEVTEFDSLGNEMIIVTKMGAEAINELTYFNVDNTFITSNETQNNPLESFNFSNLNGTYVIDLNHKIFQLGEFKNGKLWNGKQCELDDVMNLLEARIVTNGTYIQSYISPIKGMN